MPSPDEANIHQSDVPKLVFSHQAGTDSSGVCGAGKEAQKAGRGKDLQPNTSPQLNAT